MPVYFYGGGAAAVDGSSICVEDGRLTICSGGVKARHIDDKLLYGLMNSLVAQLADSALSQLSDADVVLGDAKVSDGWLNMLTVDRVVYDARGSCSDCTVPLPGAASILGSCAVPVDDEYGLMEGWVDPLTGTIWVRLTDWSGSELYAASDCLLRQAWEPSENVFIFIGEAGSYSWYTEGLGVVSRCSYDSISCVEKTTYCHPNGGFTPAPSPVARGSVAIGFYVYRACGVGTDCPANRTGVETAGGSYQGYGAVTSNTGNQLCAERGDSAATWTSLTCTQLPATPCNHIFAQEIELLPGGVRANAVLPWIGVTASTSIAEDAKYSTFNALYVKGGRPYYVYYVYARRAEETEPKPTLRTIEAYVPPIEIGSISKIVVCAEPSSNVDYIMVRSGDGKWIEIGNCQATEVDSGTLELRMKGAVAWAAAVKQ